MIMVIALIMELANVKEASTVTVAQFCATTVRNAVITAHVVRMENVYATMDMLVLIAPFHVMLPPHATVMETAQIKEIANVMMASMQLIAQFLVNPLPHAMGKDFVEIMVPANALMITTEIHVQLFVMMMIHAMVKENVTIMGNASALIHFMEKNA
jgi:hypothetical protein